jgi:two-component system, LytTR family, response regulator LytT
MKVLIVEDEQLGVERLQKQLHEIDEDINILGNTDSIKASVRWLNENGQPDVIFMDIELADGQSFEIFKQVDITSPVIFTTSYDEYALKAFKVNSVDYLLKPIKKEDLKNALDKLRRLQKEPATTTAAGIDIENLVQQLKAVQPKNYRNRFLVKQGQRLIAIETDQIAYFYSEERLSMFKTWDKHKYIVDYNLEELEAMLDPKDFYRLNRGFIAHVKSIAQIHNYFNGKLKLELKPETDKEVVVSREKAQEFKDWMGR